MKTLLRLLNRSKSALRKTAPVRPSAHLTVEGLEDRLVPTTLSTTLISSQIYKVSILIPPQVTWIQSNLIDAGVRAVVQNDYLSNGGLNRAAMLDVFREVEADGVVSTGELMDLRKIVSNGAYLGMPDYVLNLANKVVNDDPGNATYQAMQPVRIPILSGFTFSYVTIQTFQTTALGDLHVGSSSLQLSELVNKWFMGMDMPTLTDSSFSYSYDSAGSLFGASNTISYGDITQGQVGDCYFMSALADLANQSPSTIRNMFIDNGDGTFTVRFNHNGASDFVTVNRWLPLDSYSRFAYADMGLSFTDASAKLWAPLLEKAYAQVDHSGWIGQDGNDSYGGIAGGWSGVVFPQLTGLTGSSNNTLNQTNFTSAVTSGQLVCLSTPTFSTEYKTIDGFKIVGNHEYAVVGYDATSKKFTIFNPWGLSTTNATPLFMATWSQVTDIFNSWDAGANPAKQIVIRPIWLTTTTASLLLVNFGGQSAQTQAAAAVFASDPVGVLPVPAANSGVGTLPVVAKDDLTKESVDGLFAVAAL